jgi:adhesin transport system membrane fusion protein
MLFNELDQQAQQQEESPAVQKRIARLESYHRQGYGLLLFVLLSSVVSFVAWSMHFTIDEVARATGEVIASSRVQMIQSVDGGVIAQILVKEGDRVKPGQELARLDQTRVGATVGEVEARLFALKAKAIRLRAEVTNANKLTFPKDFDYSFKELVDVERALFHQRRVGLSEEIRTLKVAKKLSQKELNLLKELLTFGDVSSSELIRAERAVNEADANLINRKNKFLEEARLDLSRAEDEIGQNEQVLNRRLQEQQDSVFISKVMGIVKNIRITTVGGVLRAGEELMQIVPIGDELIIEAKVSPADIARVRKGLEANIRFDPFDFTIFGSVEGKVIYVSADTIKEDTQKGEDIFYQVHVASQSNPATTTTGKTLDILPGMTVQVDIRTGERSLIEYLLKPLRKTLAQSFGER